MSPSEHPPNGIGPHAASSRRPLEPLPSECAAELHELDARIAQYAQSKRPAADLSRRVFEASAPMLPPADRDALQTWRQTWKPRRLVGTVSGTGGAPAPRRVVFASRRWSGLALAAGLGIAFVVTAVVMQRSQPSPSHGPMPVIDGTPVVRAAPPANAVISAEWLQADPLEAVDDRVAHILDTAGLSSIDEVAGELHALIAALEM